MKAVLEKGNIEGKKQLFPKERSEKKKWFFTSAKLMQSFGIFIYCAKSQKKKVYSEKSFFFSQSPYFQ